jgi:hypothetical protein
MTSDQDPMGRTTNDAPREGDPMPPDNLPANDRAAVTGGAGNAGGGPAMTGSAASRLPAVSLGAIALSVLSLVVAITGPLWSPTIYGNPGSEQFMVLGVAQLRPALLSNEPFRNELTLVRRVMPSQPDVNQALETLAAYADKGVPTLPELRASFVDFANAIVLEDVVGTNPGGFERALISAAAALHLHALAHWLHDTRPASAIVWEAKIYLDTGDLTGASAALGKLKGPEAKVAEPWIKAVQSRIAANQVLELLETVAQSRVGILAQRS